MTNNTVRADLAIEALHEPGTLSRILEFFVLRDIELDSVTAARLGADRQTVHLSTCAVDANEAAVIASKIEQIVSVLSVSLRTTSKPARSIAPLSSVA